MLKKLSLAALVAMGSMSVASATDLSSAIKGVDLKGALRIRLYNENPKDSGSYNKWRTNAAFIFAVPVSEDLKLVDRISTETYVKNGTTGKGADTVNSDVKDNVLFAKYSKDGLTVLAGKIPVATPITDTDLFGPPSHGAGALATYKVTDSLTLAGAFVDALVATDPVTVGANNTYAAAAIFNSDIADAQLWFFNVNNTIDSDIVFSADIKALEESGVALHVDYAQASLAYNDNTQKYYNVSASFKKDAFCAKLGYAATGKDGGVVALDVDSKLSAVAATHQKYSIINTADNDMIYAKLGFQVDPKTSVYAAYTTIDKSYDDDKTKGGADEVEVGGAYKYTKKFTLSAYYSILSDDTNGDNNEFRAEAQYKF